MKYPIKKMLYCSVAWFCLLACKQKEKEEEPKPLEAVQETKQPSPCAGLHDTTFHLQFKEDSSTKDYYDLLSFVESSTAFNRYNKHHEMDSAAFSGPVLTKVLCYYNPAGEDPKEEWILDGVFTIRYFLVSSTPLKKEKHTFPKLDLVQLNFTSEKEKETALAKINEIGWGHPYRKGIVTSVVSSKTRIIIVQSHVTDFIDANKELANMIEKQWIKKFNY